MTEAVESPLRGDAHGGFGERPGETGREKPRHRAPGRLNHAHADDYEAEIGDDYADALDSAPA
ncbi:hypothetical protein Psed_0037 [Pseudonocardia dioxanivorans CB1190]|uniref:Uncharacterized protein n=1 Tax=Pseudonocardia dioxanivorans (strain ATCC 55486 / DSM 44775 / JCM 13855 / CB1190) TaxID=675635 RepID=F4CK96_PSEUX|nr:hypothetical protein Psed_0037 [Pseudonocardia dioxanivorans CB1190]